ncbi:hypothetical protein M0802_004865 [Mischocyttarus mexicanus]|nr:hypothetical protein M0802_004865 [Mischocyttarus mexicanus]
MENIFVEVSESKIFRAFILVVVVVVVENIGLVEGKIDFIIVTKNPKIQELSARIQWANPNPKDVRLLATNQWRKIRHFLLPPTQYVEPLGCTASVV